MSLWQIAQAATLTWTSPGPRAARSTVSVVSGALKTRQTAALVFIGSPREIRINGKGGFRGALRSSSAVLMRGPSIFVGRRSPFGMFWQEKSLFFRSPLQSPRRRVAEGDVRPGYTGNGTYLRPG